MEAGEWLQTHWFDVLSSVGIIASLAFTGVSLRSETKTRKISNLLEVTGNHREIWQRVLSNPKLCRIHDANANLVDEPITKEEHVFTTLVIAHVNSVFYAIKNGLIIEYDGLTRDIREFFSLPITQAVWDDIKGVQNDEFVEFIETTLRKKI